MLRRSGVETNQSGRQVLTQAHTNTYSAELIHQLWQDKQLLLYTIGG
jgi:hypothetical protein